MNEHLKIGVIVKPQGVKGEVKIMPLTDDIGRFKSLKRVLIDGMMRQITGIKIASDFVIASISGITDRNDAESYRGKFLEVNREDAVELQEGEYFIADLIGCEVSTDDGERVGKVLDVTNAKTDYFTVEKDGKIVRFPFLKDLVKVVDVEDGKIVLDKKRFGEVACYED